MNETFQVDILQLEFESEAGSYPNIFALFGCRYASVDLLAEPHHPDGLRHPRPAGEVEGAQRN